MNSNSDLPLTEVTFFILLSLANAPKHGYAIMKDVEELSDGRVLLATGTLYSALHRLLGDGWIERIQGEGTASGGRRRKYYRLTEDGQRILAMESARLRRMIRLTELVDRQA